jgi:hypothetical protein
VELKLNWTHQLLAYADDGNPLGDNTATIHKNMETLIDASKEVGLERILSICCCLVTRIQIQNRDIEMANRSFENVSHFKYLETTVTNRNLIQEEIRIYKTNFACGSVWV